MIRRPPTFDASALAHALPRLLERRLGRFSLTPDSADAQLTARLAALLAEAMGAGSVCITLTDAATACCMTADALLSALAGSGLVTLAGKDTGEQPRPLVLDEDGRLYLARYHGIETRLARSLLDLATAPALPVDAMAVACLQQIFAAPTQTSGRVNWQQLAVARALTSRLTIISGGPGTGKTTTVANLLACLLAGGADLRVALAAPTGKAAVRMEEALRQRAETLPANVRARLPTDSYTLHRLLGFNPSSGRFRHDAGNPLPFDVVVVDEASMIDLVLAARLLDAIGKDTRLVLLGDRDQLAAVENGIVLGDIAADAGMTPAAVATLAPLLHCEPDTLLAQLPITDTPSPLRGQVIWLQENYRFGADSGIGQLATAIRDGAIDTVVNLLTEAASADIAMIDDNAPELDATQLDRLAGGYDAYLAVVASGGTAEAVFAAFGEYRVLTALREGSRGASGISRLIGQRLYRQSGVSPLLGSSDEWWPGRAVIILENDYGVGLFNGDIGIALADPSSDKLLVCFPGRDGTIRRVAPTRLPRHTDAWAMTVHKAQGSEFARVDIVLPAVQSAVLTRELLYTAVTRAREHVCLIGCATRLIEGIGNPTRRNGGLLASLRRLAERDGAQPL